MPELPEVETVRNGLAVLLGADAVIQRVELRRADLRTVIPKALPRRLAGQPIIGIRRRAKYLLFDTPKAVLLCHLGMTGTWRIAPDGDDRAHDHCVLHLRDGRRLVYRDPRRFGLLDVFAPKEEANHVSLKPLGPEPLGDAFTAAYLHSRLRGRKAAVKTLIMDQAVVVGVGNIYAAEALFRSGIRPNLPARSVTLARCEALVEAIQVVLSAAIRAGGSTISDFRQAGGDAGYFQHDFRVYGREGEPCRTCATLLVGEVIGGRASVWCRRCQR